MGGLLAYHSDLRSRSMSLGTNAVWWTGLAGLSCEGKLAAVIASMKQEYTSEWTMAAESVLGLE